MSLESITEKDKFLNFLKESGHRYTKEREEILNGILSIKGHFDVENLLFHLKKQNSKISMASIYRTIPLLLESEIIKEVEKSEKRSRYELTYGEEHHDHMVCNHCGKVIEFFSEELERLQEKIAKEYGFKPQNHTLEIFGFCRNCRN